MVVIYAEKSSLAKEIAGYRIKAREKKQKEQEQLELRMLSMENQIKVLQELREIMLRHC